MSFLLGSIIDYCAKAVDVISWLLEEASEGSLNMDYELRVVVEKVAISSQEVVKRDTIKVYDIKRPESILDLGLRHTEQISVVLQKLVKDKRAVSISSSKAATPKI